MNKLNRISISLSIMIAIMSFCSKGFSQFNKDFPTIGNKMPEFILSDVNYYNKKTVSNADLQGKWYILDFWIMGCAPCVENFPKVNEMVKEFKGKVEIIQVGNGGKALKAFYEINRKKKKLDIPMAFDLLLADRWQVSGYPKIFIVDDKGILRVITNEMDSEKLNRLISRGNNEFIGREHKELKKANPYELYFANGNGGPDTTFLFRSVLAKGDSNYRQLGIPDLNHPSYDWNANKDLKKGRFQLMNFPLIALYNTAYFGQYLPPIFGTELYNEAVLYPTFKPGELAMPILEIRDSVHFFGNQVKKEELFSYSLSVPKERANREEIMRNMQLDLQKFFGYNAKVELRERDVWNLVVENPELVKALTTTRNVSNKSREGNKVMMQNIPIKFLLEEIWVIYQNSQFFDKTGIVNEIDLDIELTPNIQTIRSNLRKAGLDLIKEKKLMKVLVISDPKAPL